KSVDRADRLGPDLPDHVIQGCGRESDAGTEGGSPEILSLWRPRAGLHAGDLLSVVSEDGWVTARKNHQLWHAISSMGESCLGLIYRVSLLKADPLAAETRRPSEPQYPYEGWQSHINRFCKGKPIVRLAAILIARPSMHSVLVHRFVSHAF